jgi:Xaa-Pro aminopeptidase
VNRSENLLIVADSEHDANMLYATGMFVPDPFIYLRLGGRALAVMNDLEIDRARRQMPGTRVLSLSAYQRKLRDRGARRVGYAEIIRCILHERRVRSVVVPDNFPLGLAAALQKLGIKVQARSGSFLPERERKSPAEVRKIIAALRTAEVGMAEGIRALKAARAGKDRRLKYQGSLLTSERLRSIIDTAILQNGGNANRTIVAGGRQGCDPHEPGHGPLRSNEPIILDIFPRDLRTGYFGDITRTVVRGRATEAIRQLYDTVLVGQALAFQRVRANVSTAEVHRTVASFFESKGYRTGRAAGRMQGFFHGTGHGVGLEIHEAPRMGAGSEGILRPGQVVTVEPGLYYWELGGIRLEDMALVTGRTPRNLTRFEKVLEI